MPVIVIYWKNHPVCHSDFWRTTKGTLHTLPCSFAIAFGQRYHLKYKGFARHHGYCRGDSRGDSVLLGFNFFPENIVGLRFM